MPSHTQYRIDATALLAASITAFKSDTITADGFNFRAAVFDRRIAPSDVRLGDFEVNKPLGLADVTLADMLTWEWVQNAGIVTEAALAHHIADNNPTDIADPAAAKAAYEANGTIPPWQSWAVANWETRWRVCGYAVVRDLPRAFEFLFIGSWSHVAAVWTRIRNKWPGINFAITNETTGAVL